MMTALCGRLRRRACALLLPLVLVAAAQAQKPALAVLPVASDIDEGALGGKIRRAMNEKFLRSYEYVCIRPEDADAVIAAAGFRLTPATQPAEVARLAAEKLQCRYVLWGFCTRDRKKRLGWTIRFVGMDLEKSREELAWDFSQYVTSWNDVRLAANRFAEDISGYRPRVALEPEVPQTKQRPFPRENLVKNSGFEQGRETPDHWQCINNLTTFWGETGGNPGRCLRVNTDVLDDQAMEWRQAMAQGADFRKPPKRKPTRPPKYDTIAGLHGVHYHSNPIPIKRGVIYRVTVDLNGPEGAKVFTKGYAPFKATGFAAQDREIYRNYLACKETGKALGNGYKQFSRTFLPNPFYALLNIEDLSNTPHADQAAHILRERMQRRDFPLIPLDEQKRRLAKTNTRARFDTPQPELVAVVRDRLLCAHGVYGKVERTEKGLFLFLRLMSSRIKQNIPILDLKYPVRDEGSIAVACNQFLTTCGRRFPFVRYIRVIPYPYWPPGMYRFDNVTLTEEGDTLW